jgi:hypothetical protein
VAPADPPPAAVEPEHLPATEIVLELADFEAGWRAEADEHEDDQDEFDAKCLGVNFETDEGDTQASSAFAQGEQPTASSGVIVLASAAEATQFAANAGSEDTLDCIRGSFETATSDSTITAEIGAVSFPSLGDASFASEAVLHSRTGGVDVTTYVDIVVMQRSRAVAVLTFFSAFTPMDVVMREDLARKVLRRMAPGDNDAEPDPSVEEPPEDPPAEEPVAAFPPGYPKRVPMSAVPERMRWALGSEEGAKTAIAIAEGVWTFNAPGTSVLDDALYGAHYGWCAAVEAYEREYGIEAGGSCW